MFSLKKILNLGVSGSSQLSESTYSMVDLFYWKPKGGGENFGDHLSKIIVTKALADRGLFLDQAVKMQSRLLGIGSILHFAKDGDVIWGSGVNGKIPEHMHQYRSLDIRAVRGPKTREFLIARGLSVPEIYGDPALLLSTFLPVFAKNQKIREVIFVPNLHDLKDVPERVDYISPLMPWNVCVDAITSSKFVVATSLHGLIVADTYGIPTRYLRLSENENLFKYEDYVLGTGRESLIYATSFEEALEMGGMSAPVFSASKLLRAFPFDLWDRPDVSTALNCQRASI